MQIATELLPDFKNAGIALLGGVCIIAVVSIVIMLLTRKK